MIREYFLLFFKVLKRKLVTFGLNPTVGIGLITIVFCGLSVYLFSKTEYAKHIYVLLYITIVTRLSKKDRNDFLKSTFTSSAYIQIRIIENLLIALPFAIFLAIKGAILSVVILFVAAVLMTLFKMNNSFIYRLKTPFYKRLYEFAVGFRNTYYLFLFCYALTIVAVIVNNFNLGAFAMALVFWVSLSFYSKPENEYFVWVYKRTSKAFLLAKIKMALLHVTYLHGPILSGMTLFFPQHILVLLGIAAIGYCYLIMMILAKYSAYPKEISLPQLVLISGSLLLPPLLIGTIPFFYFQSIKKLNEILQ